MCAVMQISIETKFVRHFSYYHKSHFKGHHILGGEVFSGQISSTLSYLLSLSLNCTVSRCFLSICSLSTLLAFSKQRTLSLSWFSLTLLASRDFLAARLFFLLRSQYFSSFFSPGLVVCIPLSCPCVVCLYCGVEYGCILAWPPTVSGCEY